MDAKTEEGSNIFYSIFIELFTSPLNLGLLGICGFLLYKIISGRKSPEPVPPKEPELPKMKRRDMTLEQLREYDGKGKDGRILIAVNGKIFDVTRGKRFYGPEIDRYILSLELNIESKGKMASMDLDLREDYLKVGVLPIIIECPVPRLTATATIEMKKDNAKTLGLTNVRLNMVSLLPYRPNIQLRAIMTTEKFEEELALVNSEIVKNGIKMKKFKIYVNSIMMYEQLQLHFTLNDKADDDEKVIGSHLL